MCNKIKIIRLFKENVLGKTPITAEYNQKHDGKGGHWLEKQFGIKPNGKNEADIYGYELKKDTRGKTTFGDWSANEYIFSKGRYSELFLGSTKKDRQNSFLYIFGSPNSDKENRYSWSGRVFPKIGDYNEFGQKLIIRDNKDIEAIYSYSKDKRINKEEIIPDRLKEINELVLATWYGEKSPTGKGKTLKSKLEDKFNQDGWFTCKRNNKGEYEKICFGEPINFDNWIQWVEEGKVFLDSGMHEGNPRQYSSWRSNNTFWETLIVEEYTIDEINKLIK